MKLISHLMLLICVISCGKAPLFTNNQSVKIVKNSLVSTNDNTYQLEHSSYLFGIEWIKNPIAYENSAFKLRFWNLHNSLWGPYIEVKPKLCVFLWMQMSDGNQHGSSPVTIQKLSKDDEVIYFIDDVYFVMSGKWQVRVRLIEEHQDCQSDILQSFLSEKIVEVYIN